MKLPQWAHKQFNKYSTKYIVDPFLERVEKFKNSKKNKGTQSTFDQGNRYSLIASIRNNIKCTFSAVELSTNRYKFREIIMKRYSLTRSQADTLQEIIGVHKITNIDNLKAIIDKNEENRKKSKIKKRELLKLIKDYDTAKSRRTSETFPFTGAFKKCNIIRKLHL